MFIHLVFDILALVSSVLIGYWFRKRYHLDKPNGITQDSLYHYYLIALLVGLAIGAIGLGTLNTYLSGQLHLAKSMLGGIVGAIIAAEIFKYFTQIKTSTGLYFVPSLIMLVGIGRIGCFLAGLPDYTYGIESNLPWGVDFGDGIKRHPVQLYETLAMLVFLVVFLKAYPSNPVFWQTYGFYIFIVFYALQRFGWEFLKPYSTIAMGLNLFQWLCLGLMLYALIMIKRTKGLAKLTSLPQR